MERLKLSSLIHPVTRLTEPSLRTLATTATRFPLNRIDSFAVMTGGTILAPSRDVWKVFYSFHKNNKINLNETFKSNETECRFPESILNGTIKTTIQVRENYFLSGDVISYECDDGFVFHEGTGKDYVYNCQTNGRWDNARVPICVKSKLLMSE